MMNDPLYNASAPTGNAVDIRDGSVDPQSSMNMHKHIEEELNEQRGNAPETDND